MYYTKYDYNDAHQLVSKHSEFIQMDSEAQGDFHYKSNNDTVNYEYDAEGRLAKENHPGPMAHTLLTNTTVPASS